MILSFLTFLFIWQFNSNEPVLKSLQYYVNNNVSKLPVIRMNSSDKLTINFEIESIYEPSFNIKFKFCDSEWEPYDNLLLEGIGENTHYNINLNRLPHTTDGAEYYYSEKYPNRDVKFNNSGKWMFFITDSYDEDIIYEWGKFYVVENVVELNTDYQKWRREGSISSNNANDRVINFKANFTIPDSLSPFRIDHLEIVKNFELEYPIIIQKETFSTNRGYEWDGSNNFTFFIRDLEPGNEYRQINLQDKNKYDYPVTRARFDGIEYSRFYSLGSKDFNGGFRLMDRNNVYSDYLVAKFEFKPHEKIYDDIFIVGSFTNWEVLPWYKLQMQNDTYFINIELKRGIYDYQYVSGNLDDEMVADIDWRIFEGNYWETENVYSIFLYYKSPEKGEFDQIISYRQIVR